MSESPSGQGPPSDPDSGVTPVPSQPSGLRADPSEASCDHSPWPRPDHVVGIGASAGGLEALKQLVGQLTTAGSVSYVVAQHLAPDHPSLIVDLLAQATALPVVTAEDGERLRPGVIAVVPPNRDLRLEGDRVCLLDPQPRFAPSPCIDLFFDSIAEHWGDNGVAVVLSGTGSDGARGLLAVRAHGGLTLVQSPETARFQGMPRSAIDLGGADLVLEAAAIGQMLTSRIAVAGDWLSPEAPEEPASLAPLLLALQQISGIDFSQYKDSTLQRQVRRRMAIRQVDDAEAYLALLRKDPEEPAALVRNLLVTVTAFFRDPLAFRSLAERLQADLASADPSRCLRVWVPGCATGEEVYTMAMVVSAVLGHPADLAARLRIFATDLDEGSLVIARRAVYPLSAAEAIPPDLRARFVTVGPTEIEIAKGLRNCAVFARHNVGEDPPFPNLDLISCRNTLIYFRPILHDRVLDLFRFALQPGGLLLLGGSESLASSVRGFAPVDAAQHLYVRTSEPRPPGRPAGLAALRPLPPGRLETRASRLQEAVPEQHLALLEALLRTLARPSLVLDEHHELILVIGDVTPFCRIPEGRISMAAGSLLRPELLREARALFLLVRAEGTAVRSHSLSLEGGPSLHLEARPVALGERSVLLLSFVVHTADAAQREAAGLAPALAVAERDGRFDAAIERLERELLASQDDLRRSLAELEQANEELEASSEELQASSEELQSSNEELEASNEELQASNEELADLNQKLRRRGEELERLNTELENIQMSLSQGMVIVDEQLRIRRFSPLAVRVFGLLGDDIGQPLLRVPTTVPMPGLSEALRSVLAGDQSRCGFEASSGDVAYLVQVLPYQERDGRRCGAIVTLTEVSELVALRRVAEASLAEFASLADALEEVVWKRDRSMQQLLYGSQRIQALTGWTPAELGDQPGRLDALVHPEDRQRLAESRDLLRGAWSVDYRLISREGKCRWVRESARVLEEGDDSYVVGTLTDISALRELQEQSRDLQAVFASLFQTDRWGVAVVDDQGTVAMANPHFCALLDLDPAAIEGVPCSRLEPVGSDGLRSALREALIAGAPVVERSLALLDGAGHVVQVEAEIRAVPREAASARAVLIIQKGGASVPQSLSQKVK